GHLAPDRLAFAVLDADPFPERVFAGPGLARQRFVYDGYQRRILVVCPREDAASAQPDADGAEVAWGNPGKHAGDHRIARSCRWLTFDLERTVAVRSEWYGTGCARRLHIRQWLDPVHQVSITGNL